MNFYNKYEAVEEKSFFIYLKDTAFIIVALTAFTYLLSFSYVIGERNYYGIKNIAISNFDLIAMLSSARILAAIIGFPIMIYLFVLILNNLLFPGIAQVFVVTKSRISDTNITKTLEQINCYSKSYIGIMMKVLMILFFSLIMYVPYFLKKNIKMVYIDAFPIMGILILFLFLPLFTIADTKYEIKLVTLFKNVQENLVTKWKNFKIFIKILILLLIICLSPAFSQYLGEKNAEEETKFNILIKDNKEYVILDKDKTSFLVVPLNENHNKSIIYQNQFKIINTTFDKVGAKVKFKYVTIDDGIKVEKSDEEK